MRLLLILLFTISMGYSKTLTDEMSSFSAELFNGSTLESHEHIAVLPFETKESHSGGDLGTAIAEILISQIIQNHYGKVVERTQLKAVIQEQMLSESGMVDQSDMIELGKLASAEYLVTGKVLKAMGAYLISAQLLNTTTSEIKGSAQLSIPASQVDNDVSKLYEEHNYPVESAMRSLLIPGWGQSYSGEKGHAITSAILCYTGVGLTIFTGVVQGSAHNDYTTYHEYMWTGQMKTDLEKYKVDNGVSHEDAVAHFENEESNLFSTYEDKKTAFTIAASVTGGLWALNVIDAIFMGKRAENNFQLYFSSNPFNQTYSASFAFNF